MPKIPDVLADLGDVFVPVDPGEKGPTVPRTEDFLRSPDHPVMAAYLDAGHSYAIAARGDLAIIDADEPDVLDPVLDALPETAWQVSGSRTSEHYFLFVPGLDDDIPLDDPRTGENVGHVKASEQSVVIGPGSRHASGNRYGPLHGDEIATLTEGKLRWVIAPYARDGVRAAVREETVYTIADATALDVDDVLPVIPSAVDPFITATEKSRNVPDGDAPDVKHAPVEIGIYDVLSRASYPPGERRPHPFHGSDTGANFFVRDDGETWGCWRNCGNCASGVTSGHASYLLGMEQGVIQCGDWEPNGLDAQTWREIFDAARSAGYDIPTPEESVRKSPDVARCPECDRALGDHRRDPLDPDAYRCPWCDRLVTEDEAFAHA